MVIIYECFQGSLSSYFLVGLWFCCWVTIIMFIQREKKVFCSCLNLPLREEFVGRRYLRRLKVNCLGSGKIRVFTYVLKSGFPIRSALIWSFCICSFKEHVKVYLWKHFWKPLQDAFSLYFYLISPKKGQGQAKFSWFILQAIYRRKIRLMEGNAKYRHPKKWPGKGLCGSY